jgi:hypothetical protein
MGAIVADFLLADGVFEILVADEALQGSCYQYLSVLLRNQLMIPEILTPTTDFDTANSAASFFIFLYGPTTP